MSSGWWLVADLIHEMASLQIIHYRGSDDSMPCCYFKLISKAKLSLSPCPYEPDT